MKKNKNTGYVRNIAVKIVGNKKDAEIVEKAIKILDKAGYTICAKTDLVIENEM